MRLAILDIGTASIKALIARDGKFIFNKKYGTLLGENFNGRISDEKIVDFVKIMNKVVMDVRLEGAQQIKAFGTEIFRRAENCDEVLKRVKERAGVDIQVLSQDDELDIFWKGLMKDYDKDGLVAAIDIGGGSVQFMYGDKNGLKGRHKLKTGVIVLRDKFIKSEPSTVAEYEEAEQYILEQIKDIGVVFPEGTPFIHGSSAVIDFYKEAGMQMEEFSHSKQHPYKVDLSLCQELYETMRILPKEEKIKFFPSNPVFAELCSLGLANLLLIAKKTGLKFELPSNNNILYGFLD